MSAEVMEIRGISKRFGGVVALDAVDIVLDTSQPTALIGPNGSGKTTMFNIISGFLRADGGRVRWQNQWVDGLGPRRMVRLGITRTFQQRMLFDRATVMENIAVAGLAAGLSRAQLQHRVDAAIEEFDLSGWAGRVAAGIPFGVARRVAVAAATMSSPRLLLLDEPAAGLSDEESLQLDRTLRVLIDRGIGLFLVDHNMDFISPLCARMVVLANGKLIADGDQSVLKSPEVISAYLD
jgi:ABC-type branched-subunit amino acid transport system ATPase component